MYTLKELKPLIIEWAKERDLINPENADKQRLKLIEECGELASAILKNDIKLQKDAIGDIFIVLTILEAQLGYDLDWSVSPIGIETVYAFQLQLLINSPSVYTGSIFHIANNLSLDIVECVNISYNEIKDRKGKTENGTFIKEQKS